MYLSEDEFRNFPKKEVLTYSCCFQTFPGDCLLQQLQNRFKERGSEEPFPVCQTTVSVLPLRVSLPPLLFKQTENDGFPLFLSAGS
jgi:hypothetical protein